MKLGFSLIEVVVTLGILVVVVAAGTKFMVQVMQNNNKVYIENEVWQNATKIMQEMTTSIRSAKCVSYSGGGISNKVLTTYADDCGSAIIDTYTVTFDPVSSANSGKITKVKGTATSQLNSNGVVVMDCLTPQGGGCSFGFANCTNGLKLDKTGLSKGVKITLTVQAAVTAIRKDVCARAELVDTAVPRMQ